MKKFLLIVNTTVLLFIFSLSILPSPIVAQTQSQTNYFNPVPYLVELLKILLNLGGQLGGPPPPRSPYPTDGIYPTLPISPFVSTAPDPNISSINELVQNISTYCGGYVRRSNVNCLDNFLLNPNTKTFLIRSADTFSCADGLDGCLQCVDFVKGVVAMTSGTLMAWFGGSAMAAITNPPSGYQFIRKDLGTIQAGDLPLWDYDTWGHVAYAIQNYGDGTIQVAEANYEGMGGVRIAQKTLASPNLVGWLRKL